jgi:hypothetical protein
MENLFDDTAKTAMNEGLVSLRASADGMLARANATFKSCVPIEVAQSAEEFMASIRAWDQAQDEVPGAGNRPPASAVQDKGNPSVGFRGEKRGDKPDRSKTDPDCWLASKGSRDSGAYSAPPANAIMENRNRFLIGFDVEAFRGPASETDGCIAILDRAKKKLGYDRSTLGADKGILPEGFIDKLFERSIEPHVAALDRGKADAHRRVSMRERGLRADRTGHAGKAAHLRSGEPGFFIDQIKSRQFPWTAREMSFRQQPAKRPSPRARGRCC